jgi:hypothetical protein
MNENENNFKGLNCQEVWKKRKKKNC